MGKETLDIALISFSRPCPLEVARYWDRENAIRVVCDGVNIDETAFVRSSNTLKVLKIIYTISASKSLNNIIRKTINKISYFQPIRQKSNAN